MVMWSGPDLLHKDYEVIRTIGQGSYGLIQLVRHRSKDGQYVLKEIGYQSLNDKEKEQVIREVNLLARTRHEHIVRYHEYIIDKEKRVLYLILEYCRGGDLAGYIQRHKLKSKFIAENTVWRMFLQLLLALKYCHSQRILHRDIKPANVFLDELENVKLGDFGMSRLLQANSFAQTFVGTPYYMSPEIVGGLPYNEKSDVWSLGCLIYELCLLEPPFQALSQPALYQNIMTGAISHDLPVDYSKELRRFIPTLLNLDSMKRPSIEDCLATFPPASSSSTSSHQPNLSECRHQDWENRLLLKETELNNFRRSLEVRNLELNKREERLKVLEAEVESKLLSFSCQSTLISLPDDDPPPLPPRPISTKFKKSEEDVTKEPIERKEKKPAVKKRGPRVEDLYDAHDCPSPLRRRISK